MVIISCGILVTIVYLIAVIGHYRVGKYRQNRKAIIFAKDLALAWISSVFYTSISYFIFSCLK